MSMVEAASRDVLAVHGVDDRLCARVMAVLMRGSVEYGDLFFQTKRTGRYAIKDGVLDGVAYRTKSGMAARAIADQQTGFAYTKRFDESDLLAAAAAARESALVRKPMAPTHDAAGTEEIVEPCFDADKERVLRTLDAAARGADPRITHVTAVLTTLSDALVVRDSDGAAAGDVRSHARIEIRVVATVAGRRAEGYAGGSAGDSRFGQQALRDMAREAVRIATVNLDAVPAPAGELAVVLGPGWPGVMVHEAVGHCLEGDFNRLRLSPFSRCLGEPIATEHCSVADAGTLTRGSGPMTVDDEGTPTQSTLLVENGVLRSYMLDKLNAKLMRTTSTGNGRRQSFEHLPIPRMTNTFVLPGKYTADEIMSTVKRGIYAPRIAVGQVDLVSGRFTCVSREAYLIERGKIGVPIKDAQLVGSGPDVLRRVSMVGNDLRFDPGIGTCRKGGQTLPVGVGQPTLKIDYLSIRAGADRQLLPSGV